MSSPTNTKASTGLPEEKNLDPIQIHMTWHRQSKFKWRLASQRRKIAGTYIHTLNREEYEMRLPK